MCLLNKLTSTQALKYSAGTSQSKPSIRSDLKSRLNSV